MRKSARSRRDDGFTLIELMVAMTLFLVLGAVVFSAVITMSKALDRVRVTSDITAEARVALERMARELRQANKLESAQPTSMRVSVDFDGDPNSGTLDNPEIVTYRYDVSNQSIAMTAEDASGNTVDAALLAGQVKSLTFTYTSSNWAKDTPPYDGIVTLAEAGVDGVDRVEIRLEVESGSHVEVFKTQATLRNRSQT